MSTWSSQPTWQFLPSETSPLPTCGWNYYSFRFELAEREAIFAKHFCDILGIAFARHVLRRKRVRHERKKTRRAAAEELKYGRVPVYSIQQTNGAPLRSGLRHIAAEHFGSASASLLAGASAVNRRQRHHLSTVVCNM